MSDELEALRAERDRHTAVMRQALECLEWHREHGAYGADIDGMRAALREALKEDKT